MSRRWCRVCRRGPCCPRPGRSLTSREDGFRAAGLPPQQWRAVGTRTTTTTSRQQSSVACTSCSVSYTAFLVSSQLVISRFMHVQRGRFGSMLPLQLSTFMESALACQWANNFYLIFWSCGEWNIIHNVSVKCKMLQMTLSLRRVLRSLFVTRGTTSLGSLQFRVWLRIPFFRDMTLRHWLVCSWCFEGTPGTDYAVTQRHIRRSESSTTQLWNPQNSHRYFASHFIFQDTDSCCGL